MTSCTYYWSEKPAFFFSIHITIKHNINDLEKSIKTTKIKQDLNKRFSYNNKNHEQSNENNYSSGCEQSNSDLNANHNLKSSKYFHLLFTNTNVKQGPGPIFAIKH